jgi:hypothetical protein
MVRWVQGIASAAVITMECLPDNIKMVQDPDAKRTILPYEDDNEWPWILTFSPRQHWHRLEAAQTRGSGRK